MNGLKFRALVLSAIMAASAVSVPAEGVDAALPAQKKKARRRVYTDSALLQDQNLTVPKGPSETEKAADKEFYASEDQLNASSASLSKTAPPVPIKVPAKNKNWLTPAKMADEEKDEELQWTDYSEKAWLNKSELLIPKKSEENERIERMVQERLHQPPPEMPSLQNAPAEFQQMPQYTAPQGTLNRTGQGGASMPSYRTPADIAQMNLRPSVGPGGKTPTQSGLNLLTPSAAIAGSRNSGVGGNSLQSRSPTLNSHIRTPTALAPLNMLNQNQSTKILSPLEQIRKSSPIHQRDPFSENQMPELKKSIWE